MAQYNEKFLNKKGPTDVISIAAAPFPALPGQPQHLGDLIVCVEQIRLQAKKHGQLVRKEFGHILIHGILHLIGYDHDSAPTQKNMRQEEKRLLSMIENELVGILK